MSYVQVCWYCCVLCLALVLTGCVANSVDSLCKEGAAAGDLVISELLPNPDGSDGDGQGEYIELYNASDRTLDLAGFRLVVSRSDGESERSHLIEGLSIEPGEYLVLIHAPKTEMSESPRYAYGSALGALRNSDGRIAIACGTEIVDEVFYESSSDGKALELDGSMSPDATENDDAARWCAASEQIVGMVGNYGTPGLPNRACAAANGTPPCMDEGAARPVVAPRPGDARITEWMANPDGADGDLEWIELEASATFDLNALQLGTARDELKGTVDDGECLSVGADAYVVLGRSETAAPRVDAVVNFTLGNSGDKSIFLGAEDTIIDQVSYGATLEGVSWQIDHEGMSCLSKDAIATPNEYSTGNFGTPGGPNALCVGAGQCVDSTTGLPRTAVVPSAGDIAIREWIPNTAGVDDGNEWIELLVRTPIDLNGLQIGLDTLEETIDALECLPADAGTYVVIGQANDAAPVVDVVADFSLRNSGHHSVLVGINDVILDEAAYESSSSGIAIQIDENGVTCQATQTIEPANRYDGENYGTPGEANPVCD